MHARIVVRAQRIQPTFTTRADDLPPSDQRGAWWRHKRLFEIALAELDVPALSLATTTGWQSRSLSSHLPIRIGVQFPNARA